METSLKQSEINLFEVLEKAFTSSELADYVYDIEAYLVEETDQLEKDNPELDNYIQQVVPDLIAIDYDDAKQSEWLAKLRLVINKAKKMV